MKYVFLKPLLKNGYYLKDDYHLKNGYHFCIAFNNEKSKQGKIILRKDNFREIYGEPEWRKANAPWGGSYKSLIESGYTLNKNYQVDRVSDNKEEFLKEFFCYLLQ